jgi:hypothetical protein
LLHGLLHAPRMYRWALEDARLAPPILDSLSDLVIGDTQVDTRVLVLERQCARGGGAADEPSTIAKPLAVQARSGCRVLYFS